MMRGSFSSAAMLERHDANVSSAHTQVIFHKRLSLPSQSPSDNGEGGAAADAGEAM
jgi:hypothetical protein